MLYKHDQRNAHFEVKREARIVPGRQEQSDLLVLGPACGPWPEMHYELFIREVTGSNEERTGRQEVTLVSTGRPHEFVWEWQASEKRAQQDQQVQGR